MTWGRGEKVLLGPCSWDQEMGGGASWPTFERIALGIQSHVPFYQRTVRRVEKTEYPIYSCVYTHIYKQLY